MEAGYVYALAFAGLTFILAAIVSAAIFYLGFRIGQITIRPIQVTTQNRDLEREQRREFIRAQHGLPPFVPGRDRAPGGFVPVTPQMQRQYRGVSGSVSRYNDEFDDALEDDDS